MIIMMMNYPSSLFSFLYMKCVQPIVPYWVHVCECLCMHKCACVCMCIRVQARLWITFQELCNFRRWKMHYLPTNKPTNQPSTQPTIQLTNQPTNQPTNQSMDWPIDLPTDKLTDQLTDILNVILTQCDLPSSPVACCCICCCICCCSWRYLLLQLLLCCTDHLQMRWQIPLHKRCWKEISTFTNVIPDFVAAAAAAVAAAAPDVAHLIRKTVLIKEIFVLFQS